jgi:hypothetical protein
VFSLRGIELRAPHSRRFQVLGLLLIASVGLLLVANWRQSAPHQSHAQAPHVAFAPSYVPARLTLATETSTNEGELVRHELTFTPRSKTTMQQAPLRIATNSYINGLVDPMTTRLDGSAYASVPEQRPVLRLMEVRGHQGAVEYFGVRSTAVADGGLPAGSVAKIMVTWIERPGVYVQLIGRGLPEKEIVKIVENLHER